MQVKLFENRVQGNIVNAPWNLRNDDSHRDLEIDIGNQSNLKFAKIQ